MLVSFVAAMQVEAFKTFRGEPIATTMSTGNLRKFTENLFLGVSQKDKARLRVASFYLMVILLFISGALIGAYCCILLAGCAILVSTLFLMAAIGIITVIT